jgi:chromosome condensin MukBEF complex kleisin-like MukF subunit
MDITDLFEIGELADELRDELAQESLKQGFVNLARAISESNDEEEVRAAAEIDLLERGLMPHEATAGVSAGVLAYKFTSVLRGIANLAMQPEVEEEQ